MIDNVLIGTHKVELKEGVELAYQWFKDNVENARM